MAISRLQASLASVTNELTLAAANINFDFTLIKNEAPKEYQSQGRHLSKTHKDAAEAGMIHVTARRLGALFEGLFPSTPMLMAAYGTRVSEISEASGNVNEEKSAIFAEYTGIDGASIWAAATSSTTAIHVQLLACMLARVYNGPEATSVWVELVKERRSVIASSFERGEQVPFSLASAASQTDIPRSQLADWDASARAWLRAADHVKATEQRQLMSLLDRVETPVSEELQVYNSVLSVWTSALESMEKLIGGTPQAANNGPALLAFAAWYLYPDVIVLGDRITELSLNDPLIVPGGILTIGLAKRTSLIDAQVNEMSTGLSWSLSLAHLKYYGRPILSQGQLNNTRARLTFSQFRQAVFGSLLGFWNVSETRFKSCAKVIASLQNVIMDAAEQEEDAQSEISIYSRHHVLRRMTRRNQNLPPD